MHAGCLVIAEDLSPKLICELSKPLPAQMRQEKLFYNPLPIIQGEAGAGNGVSKSLCGA